jgi:hypothetical protein
MKPVAIRLATDGCSRNHCLSKRLQGTTSYGSRLPMLRATDTNNLYSPMTYQGEWRTYDRHTKAPDHVWTIVLAMGVRDMSLSFSLCADRSSMHQAGSSSNYSDGPSSSINDVSGRRLPCP